MGDVVGDVVLGLGAWCSATVGQGDGFVTEK